KTPLPSRVALAPISLDEEERSPCTTTANRACWCKAGSFRGEDSPEFCQKCRTRCPNGMVKDRPCTPWSDIVCVPQGSGGAAWAPPRLLRGPPSLPGCRKDPKTMDRVSWFLQDPGALGPGAEDNARNEILSNRDSCSTLDSQQKMESQEPAVLTGVTVTSPRESQHLLGQAEAEGSHRRRLLVPANGADPTDTLRLFFDYFSHVVPFNSWNPLMRLMGLTDNDIQMARASAACTEDTLYEMLMRWVKKMGRKASVHSLLEALEKLGERYAKETIEAHLVDSGMFIYLEDEAGSAVSEL
uniref:TNF receptor superfamily member 10b n=1 Tax=Prolemur simus TaxID=1328070 RepID=A0A8C9DH84_PROSS